MSDVGFTIDRAASVLGSPYATRDPGSGAAPRPTAPLSEPSQPATRSSSSPAPGEVGPGLEVRDPEQFWRELTAVMPWIETVGIEPAWFQEASAESPSPDELLARIRQTPQFKKRFPGLYRQDGSMRMQEAEYVAREEDFRTLLRQYGYSMEDYQTPQQVAGFFEAEFDPNEFQSRLQTYRDLERSSDVKKAAFYVYAGLDVTTDDLYEAIVDPGAAQRLSSAYNEAVAAEPFDYDRWITRATEFGLKQASKQLTYLQEQGALSGSAVQHVLRLDTNFGKQIMDAIFTGGTGETSGGLPLEDLLASFEYAMIGAAASEAGLAMPTKERLAEIRQAGVERQQAIEGYTAFGAQAGVLDAASQRAGYGGLTQSEFEEGRFLGDASASRELSAAVGSEEAAGRDGGEFRFSEDRGRLVQRGFGSRV